MKYNNWIVLAMLAVSASCAESTEAYLADVDDENAPVPVSFALPQVSIETKAPVETSKLDGLSVGLLGVADAKKVISSWDECLLNNRKVITGVGGSLKLDPVVYYPMDSKDNFVFYGYHPHGEMKIEYGQYCRVDYALGDNDIMYAQAVAEEYNGVKGFNAKYIRAIRKAGVEAAYQPKLTFKHLLTRLDFVAKKTAEAADVDLQVNGFWLTGVNSRATLTVADLNGDTDGVLKFSSKYGAKDTIDMRMGAPVTPTTDGVAMKSMMVEPGQTEFHAIIRVVAGGKTHLVPAVIKLKNSGKFEAGYKYTLTMLINSPEEITFTTEWEEWKDPVGGGSGEEIEVG